MADGAEAVERGDAEGGGEIAVGAAAGGAFAEAQAYLRGEGFGAREERGAALVFERSTIEAAVNFETRAAMDGAKRAEASFDAAHVRSVESAKVEESPGAFGNDVDARAAFDDVGVDADTAAWIVPFTDARDLLGKLVDGVDAFLRGEAGMRGAAMNDDFGFADAFASSLEQTFWAERRLEDENGVAAASFGFDELAGGVAADFFVGGPEKNEAMTKRRERALDRFESEEGLDEAGFHVEDAWAVGFGAHNAKRHFLKGAGGIDRVVVAEDEILARRTMFLRPPGDAEMIAAFALSETLDASAAPAPFGGEDGRATVGGTLFVAGGLRADEAPECGEHFAEARLE